MKQRSIVFSLALSFSLFACILANGQTVEKSRKLSKSFLLGSSTEIEIYNKYGNIHLVTWEKDSVHFDIELSVKGPKQSKVDKTFDFIDFDFQSTKYYVIAQTNFEGSSFWNDVGDLTGTIFSSNTKTKIDYTVYLPKKATLKVVNKYGNIYTTDHTGELTIELSNGDLKAHHLSGKTNIKTDFGNCNIHQIDDGKLNINYGEFYLEESKKLNIQSKSAEIHLTEVELLEIDSKRDKYLITHLGEIKGTTYFSRINIDELSQILSLSTKYGDIDIDKFSDDLNSFDLKSINSDVILHFTDNKQYTLDMTVNEETKVYYSADITDIKTKNLEEEKQIKVNCTIGSNTKQIILLNLFSEGGSLSLKLK